MKRLSLLALLLGLATSLVGIGVLVYSWCQIDDAETRYEKMSTTKTTVHRIGGNRSMTVIQEDPGAQGKRLEVQGEIDVLRIYQRVAISATAAGGVLAVLGIVIMAFRPRRSLRRIGQDPES